MVRSESREGARTVSCCDGDLPKGHLDSHLSRNRARENLYVAPEDGVTLPKLNIILNHLGGPIHLGEYKGKQVLKHREWRTAMMQRIDKAIIFQV